MKKRVRSGVTFLIMNLFLLSALSQNINSNRYKVVTTPYGANSLTPIPSDNSERIKFTIKIENDSVFFSLKADNLENGVLIDSLSYDILSKTKVLKGNDFFFEMVPDITTNDYIPNHAMMRLFTYFPGASMSLVCRYLFSGDENKQIKYKKFESVDETEFGLIPILLCYVDDEQNNTEKFLNKFVKNNLIAITSKEEIHALIIKNIYKCLFVYQNFSNE